MAETEKVSMLAKKDWRILVVAVALGAISVVLMNLYVRSREKAEVLESVVVAAKDIPRGTPVSRGLLTTKDVPRGALGGGYVPGSQASRITDEALATAVGISAGQPIYWNDFTVDVPTSMDRYLDYEKQERLFSMEFASPLTEAIAPGDLIDIYGTYSAGGVARAFQFLPAVMVAARVRSSLLLCVTPEEALLLTVAKNACDQLTFTLRSKMETSKDLDLLPVSAADILPRAKQLSTERVQRGPRIVREQ